MKILIVIADAANGHRSAASALETEIASNPEFSSWEVGTLDLFSDAGTPVLKDLDKAYDNSVKYPIIDWLISLGFRFCNWSSMGYKLFRVYINLLDRGRSLELINSHNADIIISIHSFTSTLLGSNRTKLQPDALTVSLVTDITTVFRGWLDPGVDVIVYPSADVEAELSEEQKQNAIGPLFPLNPKLRNLRPTSEVKAELDIPANAKSILLMAGGMGISRQEKNIEFLAAHLYQINSPGNPARHTVIITGKDSNFRAKLQKKYADRDDISILGFVDNIQDYLHAADLVITKPGPASILETIAFAKPCLLTSALGYQEQENIGYARRNKNIEYIGDNYPKLGIKIEEVLQKSEESEKSEESMDSDLGQSGEILRQLAERYQTFSA